MSTAWTMALIALLATIFLIIVVFPLLKRTLKKNEMRGPAEQKPAPPQPETKPAENPKPEEKEKPQPTKDTAPIGGYILLALVALGIFVGARAAYRSMQGPKEPVITYKDFPLCEGTWGLGHDYSHENPGNEIPLAANKCRSGWITYPESWRSIQTRRGKNTPGEGACFWIEFEKKGEIPYGPFDPDKYFLPGTDMRAPIRFRFLSTCDVVFVRNE